MKNISVWASKNQKLAITFIVIIELLKITLGAMIGNYFLPFLSNTTIEICTLVIIFIVSFVQINYQLKAPELSKIALRKFRLKSTGLILLSSLFLAILAGSHFNNLGYSLDNQLFAYAGETIKIDSSQTQNNTSVFEKIVQQKQFSQKKHQVSQNKTSENSTNNTGKRVGYVLLFLLSLVLTYFGLYLTCAIACGGYGFWAILVFLLTTGIFSSGIYFLMKAFRKTLKTQKEMTHEEKKKERKRFFATWGIITAIVGLLMLILP